VQASRSGAGQQPPNTTRPACAFLLKGPKHEKILAGIFTPIRPIWIGELETISQKLQKNGWGLIFLFSSAKFFLPISATTFNIF
jgi:hypothetical protein